MILRRNIANEYKELFIEEIIIILYERGNPVYVSSKECRLSEVSLLNKFLYVELTIYFFPSN